MTTVRMAIVASGLALLFMSALFPPMRVRDAPAPRAWLFSSQIYKQNYEEYKLDVKQQDVVEAKEVYYLKADIDTARMWSQWAAIGSLTGILYLLAGLRKPTSRRKSS